ncbi:ER membrane protein complex subunit 4 [Holothuria leucospilota]|uniref:ER membrane protein complex subunit 4 n=1 Tax=Holothuria leucospilota TaxID=206669 RepID=A0A9Q1HEU5_HOLLE|nr:ER membrane protein complex subunit 4 [Holothuria leucospilota]
MATSVNVVKNRRSKWVIDLTRSKQERVDVVSPVGYTDRTLSEAASQEKDSTLVTKKCWDIALAPLKQLPMNLFLMYMAGNTISIFPIMMVGMMVWRPIQALMSLKATFRLLEGSPQSYIQMFVFFVSNLLGISLALYKCSSMGLLPIYSSDWLSFLEPQERMEFSGGGLTF